MTTVRPRRCPDCPYSGDPIMPLELLPTGIPVSDVLIIGEGPARWETRRGYPFAGDTGQELDSHYLPLAGLSRFGDFGGSQVYVTNACKCPTEVRSKTTGLVIDYDNPAESLTDSCSAYWLPEEITSTRPSIVVVLGALACRQFTVMGGHPIDLGIMHGIPHVGECKHLPGKRLVILPSYHPSIGLRNTRMMTKVREAFKTLKSWLADDYPTRGRMIPPDGVYEEVTFSEAVEIVWNVPISEPISIDLETDEDDGGKLYSLSLSAFHGTGIVFRYREGEDDMESLVRALEGPNSTSDSPVRQIIYHSSLNDLGIILRDCGINLSQRRLRIDDTMELAYGFGGVFSENLGLKDLTYRLLGYRMTEYTELVRESSLIRAAEWAVEISSRLDWYISTKTVPAIVTQRIKALRMLLKAKTQKTRDKYKQVLYNLGLSYSEMDICTLNQYLDSIPALYTVPAEVKKTKQLFNRLLGDWEKSGDNEDFDPWKRWDGEAWTKIHPVVAGIAQKDIPRMGKTRPTIPKRSIRYLYEEGPGSPGRKRFVDYAGADADMTRRLWFRLQEMAESQYAEVVTDLETGNGPGITAQLGR